MNILGLNIIHDTSAAILVNNQIVAAVEEERFNRLRHTTAFPQKAIEYCLATADLELDDIDYIALSFDFRKFLLNFTPFEQNTIAHDDASFLGTFKIVWDNFQTYLKTRGVRKYFQNKVIGVPHHLTHAYAAYYCNSWPEANILTLDGRGESEATCLYHGKDGRLTQLDAYPVKDSLGHLYTYVTHLCGLYSNIGQEGKTMGLAPYGEPGIDFSKIVEFNGQRYQINRDRMRALSRYKTTLGNLTETSKKLAWGAQDVLNDTFVFLARRMYEETGSRRFALAGGVALNATANGHLLQQDFVDELFVFPAAHDAGAAVGAALYVLNQHQELTPQKQELIYLGPEFTNEEIEQELKQSGVTYEYHEQIESVAADLLSRGKIIGWFQGRAEFGPRALGNRSILADARGKEMKDKINHLVKHRESWRPFAPAILREQVTEYFAASCPAPYMTITFEAHEEKKTEIPAVVHVNGTSRIQTVAQENNPKFYNLLRYFAQQTGTPVLLNTSLNTRGEPIVCSPKDAIDCLHSSGLEALCLGNFLLQNGTHA